MSILSIILEAGLVGTIGLCAGWRLQPILDRGYSKAVTSQNISTETKLIVSLLMDENENFIHPSSSEFRLFHKSGLYVDSLRDTSLEKIKVISIDRLSIDATYNHNWGGTTSTGNNIWNSFSNKEKNLLKEAIEYRFQLMKTLKSVKEKQILQDSFAVFAQKVVKDYNA